MPTENRKLLIRGARALAELRDECVFVGGCTTELLITDSAASEIRSTRDVDVIVETASRPQYYALSARLRERGFAEDEEVICRWRYGKDLILDVMPTDPKILGFSNRWYSAAVEDAVNYELEADLHIRLVTPPYFCATKLVAFHGRGGGDFTGSHDLEDFIAVVDGRVELVGELAAAKSDVRRYVAREVRKLLENSEFIDMLPGHLASDMASQERLPLLLTRLERIAALSD